MKGREWRRKGEEGERERWELKEMEEDERMVEEVRLDEADRHETTRV
jgi:hypothetical protein